MQETKRTLLFVGAAAVAVILAAGTHWAMKPSSLDEFSDVGEEFFPEFNDPNAATGLRVAAYNKDAGQVDVFNVEFKDGLWRIPSHHNYPADGETRLANTATSIIGIKREALVSTSPDDYKRLGVLDPLDESVAGTEGRGDRITLLSGNQVLADYIIGKKAEDQSNVYNVRRPDETRTYRAELNIDISTKFADWIEPGLLDVKRNDLREIVIDGYSIDETRGVLVPGDTSKLTRSSGDAAWELEGIAENEKVNTSKVNSIINALEDVKIVGVRAKPPGLSADLRGEGGAKLDPISFSDLMSKGYFIADGQLVSNEGEVRVGTAEGALYVLRFGEVFTGSDVEIEVGQTTQQETESDADTGDKEDASAEGDQKEDEEDAKDELKQNRYLFITAQFDESLIQSPGEKPVAPEEPAAETKEGEQANSDAPAETADAEEPSDETKPEDATQEKSTEQTEYEKAYAEYETKLEQWEADQKAFEEKLEQGKKRVSELNARFADWYYVISADAFNDIRVARADLVEAKEPEKAETDATPPASVTPDEEPPSPPETPAQEEAQPEQPAPQNSDSTPAPEVVPESTSETSDPAEPSDSSTTPPSAPESPQPEATSSE